MTQDMYFLGYPYGRTYEYNSYGLSPVPFARRALLSCTTNTEDGTGIWFLDGVNNPGFSGGPVFFRKVNGLGQPIDFAKLFLGALVSSYEPELLKVVGEDQGVETGLTVNVNSALVKAIPANHLIELIARNPDGYRISQEEPLFPTQN